MTVDHLYLLQQVLNGLHAGALYALLAFGYALTNGALQRTNLSYGALFAFCGQVMILAAVWAWQVLWLTLPLAVAVGIAAAFAYGALVSGVLGRSVFAPLAKRSPNAIIVATLGVSLVLMELARISADTRDFWLPPMLAMPVVFASAGSFHVTLTVAQLLDCAASLLAVAGLGLFLSRSRFGRHLRALRDDTYAAAMCGIDTAVIYLRTMVLGGLVAALAGILAAFYYGNISFGAGLFFGLKILFVTAVGGYETPARAAIGAGLFGIGEALWSGYFGFEWRDAWMFGFLVAGLVLANTGSESESRRPG